MFSHGQAYTSRVVRKPEFCICEKKDADQLHGTAKLISAFVFATRIVQSLDFQNTKLHASNHFCDCTARFASALIGNPKDLFSHNEAHTFQLKAFNFLQKSGDHCRL